MTFDCVCLFANSFIQSPSIHCIHHAKPCAGYTVLLCAKSLQSCPTLCHPMDCSPPGSSDHEILQARILEWVVMLSSRGLPDPGIEPKSLNISCIVRWALYYQHHLGCPAALLGTGFQNKKLLMQKLAFSILMMFIFF